MKTHFLVILIFFLIIFSCSEKTGSKSNSTDINLEDAIQNAENRRKSDLNASGGNKCLLEYQNKYDQLISEAEVLSATGFTKESLESEYKKTLDNPEYHSFKFKFANGRLKKFPFLKQKIKAPDNITIQSIKAISLAAFENSNKVISDEETKATKDVLKDVSEGNSGDAKADAAAKKAQELNVSKEEINKTGGDMLDAFKNISKAYSVVNDLGEAARWNTVTSELSVLQNGVQFVIYCDVNDDTEKNKSVAIELAKIILNKCK